MAENEMTSLRDAAMAAAEGRPVPAYNPTPDNENPTATETVSASMPLGNAANAIFAQPSGIKESADAMVGDTPVYTSPKAQQIREPQPMSMEEGARILMNTSKPSEAPAPQAAPVATSFGLDASALESSPAPGAVSEPSAAELYAQLQYAPDGSFSDDQMKLVVEHLKDVPSEQYYSITRDLFSGIENEFRLLITQAHLSVNEAQKASYDRVVQELDKINAEYKREHPEEATILIDKSKDVNDLGLTSEEHAKLEKAKKIRLVLLEDVDLASIEFEHPPEDHIAEYIRSIEGSLAKYSVPLPTLGDFVSVKGAQILQMANLIRFEDGQEIEALNAKASLIYDSLISGSILHKYDEYGERTMSYHDFVNTFPFDDMDIAIFGILCASSVEESSTTLTCQNCKQPWVQPYNVKNLLKLDNVPEVIKERTDEVLKNKNNDDALRKLYDARRHVKRYMSPFTKNVYDLSYPTIARALDILKRVDPDDRVMGYYALVALYFNQIGIYNGRTGKYVSISVENPDLFLDTLKNISNDDLNLIATKVKEDFFYRPQFGMSVTCPNCGRVSNIPLNIETLIFLKAQDSMVEIV